jgi:hypothetical protein
MIFPLQFSSKNILSKIAACLLVWGTMHSTSLAQRRNLTYPDFGFHILKGRKTASFPFLLHSNLIVISAHINNSDSLNFIFDSGVSSIIITDPDLALSQKLNRSREVKVSGAGAGEPLMAFISTGNTIKVGGVQAKNQNLIVLEKDFLEISQILGMKIHGIIGYDLFNYFVVNIDFPTNHINLHQPEHYKYKPNKGELFKLDVVDTKPYLNDVEVTVAGTTMLSRLMVDTGAGHAVSLELHEKDIVKLPPKVIAAQLGRGLNGVINGHLGRVEKLKLGKFVLNNLVASFPDTNSIRAKMSHLIDRNGNLGCDILRKFSVTFNYRDGYMLLKPHHARYREPFEHNMSGIEFIAKGQKYDQVFISKIEPNSPGAEAGFIEGDEVISINNKNIKDESLSNIYKMFQQKEGRQVLLLVRRAEELFVNTFTLRRLI